MTIVPVQRAPFGSVRPDEPPLKRWIKVNEAVTGYRYPTPRTLIYVHQSAGQHFSEGGASGWVAVQEANLLVLLRLSSRPRSLPERRYEAAISTSV